MPTLTESNACLACSRAKRRCGRQMPSCARCVDSGRSCVYPPSRSRAAVSSQQLLSDTFGDSVPGLEDGLLAEVDTTDLMITDDLLLNFAFPPTNSDFSAPSSFVQTAIVPPTRADWFLAPETWRISHRKDHPALAAVGKATMKKYITVLQSWFERWVATGSNPFIHSRLYSANFPACVQVAYATLASYIHRTPVNTDTVLQIVEDRSNDLVQGNGIELDWVGADIGEADVDVFAQLARLHALMVYQIIGLFDGDIRLRHVAEGHLAVQDRWASRLVHSAAKAFSNTHASATYPVGCLPTPSTYSQQQWYLWILSESIRRTWLVAASILPVFSALQQRWSGCPGGIMYTNRSGLWNAATAADWDQQCLKTGVAFLQRFECATLLEDAKPADIDEFGTAMLDMTFNGELLEKWRDRSGGL